MAVKRGKSQARRHGGAGAGLPGWAWMVLGIVLTIGVVLLAPKYLKSEGSDGFFRPRPNPDAQPVASAGSEDEAAVPEDDDLAAAAPASRAVRASDEPDYDFYTLLPGEEVAMTDAQLAAAAREEAARQAQARPDAAQAAAPTSPPATASAAPASSADLPSTAAAPARVPAPASPAAASPPSTPPGNDTPYILQAGAFGASGDAEAVKAKIALLGLNARVESAQIKGKTVYRVRMGPYGTASELAAAKAKLAGGGLPAMAIRAK